MRKGNMVIAAFTIPPSPRPAAVDEAFAEFDRLGDAWAALPDEIADAEAAGAAAVQEATRAVADAATAGKSSRIDPAAVEREHAEKIAALKARQAAIEIAVDEVGDRLTVAISTHRAEWADLLREHAATASAQYERALRDAKRALAAFAPVQNALRWLEDFEHVPTQRGFGFQFPGGKVRVPGVVGIGPLSGEHDPNTLLDLAAQATAEIEPPKPRTHRVAAGSRRA